MTSTISRTTVRRRGKAPAAVSLSEVKAPKAEDDDDVGGKAIDDLDDPGDPPDSDEDDPIDEDEDDSLDDDEDDDDEDDEDDEPGALPLPTLPRAPTAQAPSAGNKPLAAFSAEQALLSAKTSAQFEAEQRLAQQKAELEDFLDHISSLEFDNDLHTVSVTRLEPKYTPDGRSAVGFLATFSRPITPEEIQKRWGGGTYKVNILKKGPNGGSRFYRSKNIIIAGDPKLEGSQAHGGVVVPIKSPETELFKQMLASKEKETQNLVERVQQLQDQVMQSATKQDAVAVQLVQSMLSKPDDTKLILQRQEELAERRRAEEREEQRRREEREEQRRRDEERKRAEEARAQKEAEDRMRNEQQGLIAVMLQQQQQMQQQFQQMMMQQQAQAQAQQQAMQQQLMVVMQNASAQKETLYAQQLQMIQEMNKQTRKDDDLLDKVLKIKQVSEVLSPTASEPGIADKVLDTAGQALPAILGLFAQRQPVPQLPPAAPVQAPAGPPRILPRSIAVVDLPQKALTPAQRIRARKNAPEPTAPAEEPPPPPSEEDMARIKDETSALKIDPAEPFAFPTPDMDIEAQAKLLVVGIEKALRKDMKPTDVYSELVSKFPPTTLSLLTLAPLDTIYDKLGELAPMNWQVNTVKGQRMLEDLVRLVKRPLAAQAPA